MADPGEAGVVSDSPYPDPTPRTSVTGVLDAQDGHCCVHCGGRFFPRQKNQDHCSRDCYDRWYNSRRPAVRTHPELRQRALDFDAPSGWTPAQRELSAHMRRRESRKARMLVRLQQGEATTWELMQIGGSGWRSRLYELREDGKRDGYRIPPPENRLDYAVYRLEVAAP